MVLDAYKERWKSQFFSLFKSKRRDLRQAMRRMRDEQRLNKQSKEQLIKIAHDLEAFETKKVTADYLHKGYVSIIAKEMADVFKAFQNLIEVYTQLIRDVEEAMKEAVTLRQEGDRLRTAGKNETEKKKGKVMAQHAYEMVQELNENLDLLVEGIQDLFTQVESRQSTSVQLIKLLDKASLERQIFYDLKKDISDIKIASKTLEKQVGNLTKEIKGHMQNAFSDDEIKQEEATFKHAIEDLKKTGAELVRDLNLIEEHVKLLKENPHADTLKTLSGLDPSAQNIPSVTKLRTGITAGGFGMPEYHNTQKGSEYLCKIVDDLNAAFDKKVKALDNELRMLMTDPLRVKQKNPAIAA